MKTKIKFPYPMRLAWDKSTKVTRTTCHKKVAEVIVETLEEVQSIYSKSDIKTLGLDLYGGCLNVRKMRGGTKWSTHAFGCALDFDPGRNKLRWKKDKAHFARIEYNDWWKCWEKRGAVSLGRAKGYDYMHVQFCKVRK